MKNKPYASILSIVNLDCPPLILNKRMLPSPGSVSEEMNAPPPASPASPGRSCSVCGARANGHNFGVLSCESCKAFFRRNALKEKEASCPFERSCAINEQSRRFCLACRLDKCFKVGMRKEMLLVDKPERKRRRLPGGSGRSAPEGAATATPRASAFRATPCSREADDSSISSLLSATDVSSSSSAVTISKDDFMRLVSRASQAARPSHCSCTCTCGFYPSGTALPPPPPPPSVSLSPHSSSALFSAAAPSPSFPAAAAMAAMSTLQGAPRDFDSLLAQQQFAWSGYAPLPTPAAMGCIWRAPQTPGAFPLQPPQASSAFSPQGTHQQPVDPPSSSCSSNSFSPFAFPLSSSSYAILTPSNIYESISSTPANSIQSAPSPLASSPSALVRQKDRPAGWKTSYEALRDEHQQLLMELLRANKLMKAPIDEVQLNTENTIADAAKFANIGFRRIITMAKELAAFKRLDNGDQMALLKYGASELLLIRGVHAYDPANNSWRHQMSGSMDGELMSRMMDLKIDIFKGSEHFFKHQQFLTGFDERARTSEVLMVILHAVLLFSPHREQLKNSDYVAATRTQYSDLLQRVLECDFASEIAKEVHASLERSLSELRGLNTSLSEVVLGIDRALLDPLLIEVFILPACTTAT